MGGAAQADKPLALTAAQMREADRLAIEEIGIPGCVLMDHAGKAVWRHLDSRRIGIVCGKGNNGGDGFVTARYALLAGCDVELVLLAGISEITGDARIFLDACLRLGLPLTCATDEAAAREAVSALQDCDVLVDAMLGTGLRGEVLGVYAAAIAAWPTRHTVAVDIPSGLDADTGLPLGAAVRAEKTVTFQCLKRGFLNPEAAMYTGDVVVADIGIPMPCIAAAMSTTA